ncbi:DUF4132 domain-containing protein [Thermomonospora curvata]|uniref:DUF4132 domain-containing protein n=1 Tax=Thermomonospora curvata TaxID=2020 RepID=UPI00059D710A|nr:DUF4132 domain-containing protein [Thermomonospora curvata]
MNNRPLPDEHTFEIPASWRSQLHPRRDGTPAPPIHPDPQAAGTVRALIEEHAELIDLLVTGGDCDPELVAAVGRHLDGDPDPLGAAAIAAVITQRSVMRKMEESQAFFDSWVVTHGLGFAACAVVELSGLYAVHWRGGWDEKPHVLVEPKGDIHQHCPVTLRRARSLLASAADGVYPEAEAALAGHRRSATQRGLVSYLVPTRQDWVEECCADRSMGPNVSHLLYYSLRTRKQYLTLHNRVGFDAGRVSIYSVLPTLLEGMGPAALPLLLDVLDRGDLGEEKRQYVLGLIAELPTDEAFKGLLGRLDRRGVRPVLQAMARRFPVRALRLLAEAAPVSFDAALLLADHLSADAELAAAALRRLPPGTRTAAESAMASLARVPEAPAEAVPAVLAGPAGPRSRPVLEELQAPAPRVAWGAGERRQWLEDVPGLLPVPPDADWKALIGEFRSGTPSISIAQLVVYGPEELAWPPDEERDRRAREEVPWLKPLVARHGLRALPVAVEMAEADPAHCGTALLPFWHADVALMAAGWLTRGGDRADTARRWLDRHGPAAAPLLAPAALGKTAERRPAEWALRYLLLRHDLEEIVRAAQAVHGRRAADALEALLSAHPVETGLCPTPKIGDWLDPASLPQVLLRDRRLALPAAAAERLVALLALPFPHGVREIRRACDPRSLARFGWALLRQWREGGAPAQDDWALTQLAWTGNEETVEQLAALIPLWAEEGRHKDAAKALGVLADIGSDAALKHLHDVPRKATSKKLRQEAQRGMRRIAGRRGLSAEQLADRTVPDLGLAVDGGLVLDYGPRRFTVDLDERFKPVVTDQKGRTRKTPPSPGAKDDLLLAPAAHQRFTAFRKEARAAVADQIRRLETAMASGRRWTADQFGDFILGHPLMCRLARSLVWVSEDGDAVTAFRITEDRTLADVEGEKFTLSPSARVGVASPELLGDAVAAWSQTFAAHGIHQPFPQLARPLPAPGEPKAALGG